MQAPHVVAVPRIAHIGAHKLVLGDLQAMALGAGVKFAGQQLYGLVVHKIIPSD